MKRIIGTLLFLSLSIHAYGAIDFSSRPTSAGQPVVIVQPRTDTMILRRSINADTIILEDNYKNLELWSDTDFAYWVGNSIDTTHQLIWRTTNGPFWHFRDFDAGTKIYIDVLPILGGTSTGTIYGIMQKR